MNMYPNHPGAKDRAGSTTSSAAARLIAPKAPTIRARTLAELAQRPATAEEVGTAIDVHFMIVRARCSELRAAGLITDSGQRGDGALGGRVIVWRVTTAEERVIFSAEQGAAPRLPKANERVPNLTGGGA